MTIHEFGDPLAEIVLVQPVDAHDLALIENEIRIIAENTSDAFKLIALEVDRWNLDLSPWRVPAVFGKEDFGDGAANTLGRLCELCTDKSRTYFIGGYSLAGLFALWAAYQTDRFKAAAAVSPSVWFPGFSEYVKEETPKAGRIYLSLGDREEKTKNPVMARVGDTMREIYGHLTRTGVPCTLEWNNGNHFRAPDLRTAKGFAWLINGM